MGMYQGTYNICPPPHILKYPLDFGIRRGAAEDLLTTDVNSSRS